MALVSHIQTDAHAMHLLALVDLAAPISRFHADASSAIAGGAARISALIQFMHHKRVNSAYHILCTSKPDFTSTTATIKTLKSASRTCNIGQFHPLHESLSLKDMHSRLKRLWRVDEKHEGDEGLAIKQRNLLAQLDSHLEQKLAWFTDAQKSISPSWVLCFGTLPSDVGSARVAGDQKLEAASRQAFFKSMESSKSSLIWIECNPDYFSALTKARSSSHAPRSQEASDASDDLTEKYCDFFRDLHCNGKLAPSRAILPGLPSARRIAMLTLDEIVNDDSNPSALLDLIFTQPISGNSKMINLLQEGLKSALCDCWPEPGDDFDRVLSRTRSCDKDLWVSSPAQEEGPLLSSQAPSLVTNGDARLSQQKENVGPYSSLPASVAAAMPVKPKAAVPPLRGPRGPNLLKAAKEEGTAAGAVKVAVKAGRSKMLPPSHGTMMGRKQSDRLPKGPAPPRLTRQLDFKADALATLQAAEKIRSDYMKNVLAELEELPHLSEEKKSWAPNWDALFDLAEQVVEPAMKTLLTCSTFSVKAALSGTRALRPSRKHQRKATEAPDAAAGVKERVDDEPLSQEDQSINASAINMTQAPSAAAKLPIAKKMAADSKGAEGLGENAALLPADEADISSLASKKLIWTLLESRWFKYSSEEIYQAHPTVNGSWNGQKMRYACLAYIPYLMLSSLCHLDVRLDREKQVKDASYALKDTLDEMSFVADSIGGTKAVFERFLAPKFASRLPALMERMQLLLNGATHSDHTPDNRLSGNTADGGSSDESDANDDEVERRSSKGGGGISSKGMTASEAPGSGSASMPGVRGHGGSQRGFGHNSQPVSAADNSVGSGRPLSQYHRPSAHKMGTMNEEVDSAPKIIGGRLAPVHNNHFRSHMPGANKWRPTVAMDKKATNLPAALPPSQQQPFLLAGAAAKVSTAAPLPPSQAFAVKPGSNAVAVKPGSKPGMAKKALMRKEEPIPGGSPDVVLGATPLLKKRQDALDGPSNDAGAGLIMDQSQGLIAPMFELGGQEDNGLAPPADYGGGTWLAPAGRKRAANCDEFAAPRLRAPPQPIALVCNRGPSMLDLLLQETKVDPLQPSEQIDMVTEPPLRDPGHEEEERENVQEGVCADASDGEEDCEGDFSLNPSVQDACSPCKNSGRSGHSRQMGSKPKPFIPAKSINLLAPSSSTAATGDRGRNMRREKLLSAATKGSKPSSLGAGNKASFVPRPQEAVLKPSVVKEVAQASGGSRIPLPSIAALPSSQAKVAGSGGASGIPSLRPLDAQLLPAVAEEPIDNEDDQERKSLMAILEEAADIEPPAPPPPPPQEPEVAGPEVVEVSPLQLPIDYAPPPIVVPATITPLPNPHPKVSSVTRSSARIKKRADYRQGNNDHLQPPNPAPPSAPSVPGSLPCRSSRSSDPSPLLPAPTPPDVAATNQEPSQPLPSNKKQSAKKRKASFNDALGQIVDGLNTRGGPRKDRKSARLSIQDKPEIPAFIQEEPIVPSVAEEPSGAEEQDQSLAEAAGVSVTIEEVLGSQETKKRGRGRKAKGVEAAGQAAVLPSVPEEEPVAAVKARGRRTKPDPSALAPAPAPAPAPDVTRRLTRRQASQQASESVAEPEPVASLEITSVHKRGRGKGTADAPAASAEVGEELAAAGPPPKKRGRKGKEEPADEACEDPPENLRKSMRDRRKSVRRNEIV